MNGLRGMQLYGKDEIFKLNVQAFDKLYDAISKATRSSTYSTPPQTIAASVNR